MIHQEKGSIFNELIETISEKGLEGLGEAVKKSNYLHKYNECSPFLYLKSL
ncbi:MAG: hypothetical protein OEV42_00475 [Deltaproteobacteria bacterium]|nr:hypothetical protein [Deltaproteobacteria bacterium]